MKTKKPKMADLNGLKPCIHCGALKVKEISQGPTTFEEGTDLNGFRYTSINRVRVHCDECNQVSMQMINQFDKTKWKE